MVICFFSFFYNLLHGCQTQAAKLATCIVNLTSIFLVTMATKRSQLGALMSAIDHQFLPHNIPITQNQDQE